MMQKFNLSGVNESIIIVTTSLKHQQFDFNGDLREWGALPLSPTPHSVEPR